MICGKLKRKLSAYQDRELDRENREQVRSHLDHCPACRREYSAMTALREAVGFPLPEPKTSSVTGPVMAAIRRQARPKPWQSLARAGVFLATLVVFIAVVTLFNGLETAPGELDFGGEGEPIISLLIDKEQTSVVSVSQDLVESLLPGEVNK
jgi:anti-sigma factor RsiW